MVKSNASKQNSAKLNKNISARTTVQSGRYMDYASSALPNPGSIHNLGVIAKQKLVNARTTVANVLSCRPKEIIFTSGGTESNNLAIQGVVLGCRTPEFRVSDTWKQSIPHIITTNIEHPSVLDTCKILEARGLAEISVVPVEKNGIIDPKKIKKEIKENTVLVSVMYANNEIGTIQPIREIAKEIRHWKKIHLTGLRHPLLSKERAGERFPIFHTDAVQAANYLDLNVENLGVDLMSISGAKIESGASVGLLYKRNSIDLVKVFGGGDQESGLRPGTEDVSGVVKFSTALGYTQKIREKEAKRLTNIRDYFFKRLALMSKGTFDREFVVNGDLENRLPNNVNITIPNIPSDLLVIELSAHGVYASSKSACKEGDGKVSHVIQAINPDIKDTDGSLRFSFGRDTKKSDVDHVLRSLKEILTKLNKWYY